MSVAYPDIQVIRLGELLQRPELTTGPRYHPSKFPFKKAEQIERDRLRRVSHNASIHTLFPDETNANPFYLFGAVRLLREADVVDIPILSTKQKVDIDDIWLPKYGTGRIWGGTLHQVALSLWAETQV